MAQMNPPDDQDRTPWQHRDQRKGRKIIADACTFVVEMSANFEDRTTDWKVWKSRFTESIASKRKKRGGGERGKILKTGWENGKFVTYNDEFRTKVEAAKVERESREIDKKIGLPTIQPKSEVE